MVEQCSTISIVKQCQLLGVSRASYYYKPVPETPENLKYMELIDRYYLNMPFSGSRKITAYLKRLGYHVNRKRVSRLMQTMGIQAIYPKPKKETWRRKYGNFPYLLNNVEIKPQNHVWGTDITYIPVGNGYLYLVAVLDLYSRYVLSWELSNSLESNFCISALKKALDKGKPKIFNSDQGVQFTSNEYVNLLQSKGINISMSGKGRCWDNIFVERLWRSLKYEEVYINNYTSFEDANESIEHYLDMYNSKRLHSALNYRTPEEVYLEKL